MYSDMEPDEYGRPVFLEQLKSKPTVIGSSFYLVDVDDSSKTIIRAFRITIVRLEDIKMDPKRPFRIVYEWTSRGFIGGVEVADNILHTPITKLGEGGVLVLLAGASVVVGSGGGFTIGIVKGVIGEVERPFIDSCELLTGFFTFYYDPHNRIIKIIEHTPTEKPEPVIETLFNYRDENKTPYLIQTKSVADSAYRTILVGK